MVFNKFHPRPSRKFSVSLSATKALGVDGVYVLMLQEIVGIK